MVERADPRYPIQQVRVASLIPSWVRVPVALTREGPNGPYIEIVHRVYVYVIAFLSDTLDYLGSTGGQKTLLIKFPEAIVSIVHRIGHPISIPAKLLRDYAHFLRPLHALGGCAKPFLAIVEVFSKFKTMFRDPAMLINYVVMDEKHHPQKANLFLNPWIQWSNVFQSVVDWGISVGETEAYLRRFANNSADPFTAPLVNWGARYMSVKNLCLDGWFLYQTWWKGNHFQAEVKMRDQYVPLQAQMKLEGREIRYVPLPHNLTLAKREIVGAALKISLSVAYLSLDLFNQLAAKEKKPFWLEAAMFWTKIAPVFLTPIAIRYWPSMVTKPLYDGAR